MSAREALTRRHPQQAGGRGRGLVDSEEWKAMLKVAARFHRYGTNTPRQSARRCKTARRSGNGQSEWRFPFLISVVTAQVNPSIGETPASHKVTIGLVTHSFAEVATRRRCDLGVRARRRASDASRRSACSSGSGRPRR